MSDSEDKKSNESDDNKSGSDKFKDAINKYWPITKAELEKAAEKSKELLKQGEKIVKEVSAKSAKETKKMALNLKKERLIHKLGKSTLETVPAKWAETNEITELHTEIKGLEKEISEIQ